MPEALFEIDGDLFVPTEHGRGPWSPDQLHGGPVGALLARTLVDASDDDPQAWFPARFAAEFVRPLIIRPMRLRCRVLRAGRKARLVEAMLEWPEGDGKLVGRATLQQVRRSPVAIDDLSDAKSWARLESPEPPEAFPSANTPALTEFAFHSTSVVHRSHDGLLQSVGSARDWIRVETDLFAGEPLRPFERVVAAADFGNGISASLPFDQYTFVNPDLTVSLFRLPVDDWVLLDAVTHAGDEGVGLAACELSDRRGRIGYSSQALIIDPR